jgi:hypothetical protein
MTTVSDDYLTFRQRIDALKERSWTITEAIDVLVKLWKELFDSSAAGVNFGDCEWFAEEVCGLVPGAEAFWGDELTGVNEDTDDYAYHCFVRYNGRYYDSEAPWGVDDWRDLSCFSGGP